jgi:hypothetical protein
VRSGNVLFENSGGGRFENVTAGSGLGYQGHSSGAVFFDFDRDGLLDLYLTNVGQYTSEEVRAADHGEVHYRFHDGLSDAFGGHHYPERTEPSLLFRSIGNARFEDVTEIISVPQILISDLAQGERALNWIAIGLRGRASDRDGLGTRVTVTTADSSYLQVLDGKSGYLSQSSLSLYFGLGDASSSVDPVRVDWPSGTTQTVTDAATNTLLEIVEPRP